MEVQSIEMRYARLSDFTLHVTLRSPYSERDAITEEYASRDISDVVFVRHLGNSTVDRKPFFDGFYPLRKITGRVPITARGERSPTFPPVPGAG